MIQIYIGSQMIFREMVWSFITDISWTGMIQLKFRMCSNWGHWGLISCVRFCFGRVLNGPFNSPAVSFYWIGWTCGGIMESCWSLLHQGATTSRIQVFRSGWAMGLAARQLLCELWSGSSIILKLFQDKVVFNGMTPRAELVSSGFRTCKTTFNRGCIMHDVNLGIDMNRYE